MGSAAQRVSMCFFTGPVGPENKSHAR